MSDYVSSSTLKRLLYNKMNERTYPNAPTTSFDWWALAQTLLTSVPAVGGIYQGAVWLREKLRARCARTLAIDEERGQNDPNGETEPGDLYEEMNQNDPGEERGPNQPNEKTDPNEPLEAVKCAPVDGTVNLVEQREANGEHGAVTLPPVAGANADNDTDDNHNQNRLSLDPDPDNSGVHEVENSELNPQDISLEDAPSAPDGAIARNDATAGLDPPNISPESGTLLSDGMITATDGVEELNPPNTTPENTPSVSRGMITMGGTMKELNNPDISIEDFPSVPDGMLATIYVPEELESSDEPGVSSSSTHEHQLEAV